MRAGDRYSLNNYYDRLIEAFKDVLLRADNYTEHLVEKEKLSIRERMANVLDILQKKSFAEFSELFSYQEGRHGLVVTFIAVLELVKQSMIKLVQTGSYSQIHVSVIQCN